MWREEALPLHDRPGYQSLQINEKMECQRAASTTTVHHLQLRPPLPATEKGALKWGTLQHWDYLLRAALVQEAEEVSYGGPLLQVLLQGQGMQQSSQHLDRQMALVLPCTLLSFLLLPNAPTPHLGLWFPCGTGHQ